MENQKNKQNQKSGLEPKESMNMVLRQKYSSQPHFPLLCPDPPDLLFDYICLIFNLRKGNRSFNNSVRD